MSDFESIFAPKPAESESSLRLRQRVRFVVDVTEDLLLLMERLGVSKAQLARRLGKHRSWVTSTLNGTRNMTLNTLSDVSYALGYRPVVHFERIEPHVVGENEPTTFPLVYEVTNTSNPDTPGETKASVI